MDRLKVSPAPHINASRTTRTLMIEVIIALIPAFIWAIYIFGTRVLTLTLLSILCCVLFEGLFCALTRRKNTVGDFSAVLSGLLLAFNLPVSAPLYFCVIGSFFAMIVVKGLFGGLGKNIVNPVLAARVFLVLSFPDGMTSYVAPLTHPSASALTVDVTQTASLLSQLRETTFPENLSALDLFLGMQSGFIGEISILLLSIGGLFLLIRRVISPLIPVSFIATVALLTFFFPQMESAVAWEFMMAQLFTGGLFLAAFFMATDPTTSPLTFKGRILYGVGCGVITVFIRYYGASPEGVPFAVLIMNLLVFYLDRYARPARFGGEARGKN